MQLGNNPLLTELAASDRILIAGAGGGFDIFSGLPLYFHLKNQGKEVFLANLSFTDLSRSTGRIIGASAAMISADSDGPKTYFPERYLCEWFREQGEEVEICCFLRTGPALVREGYENLCAKLNIDCVVLVDGGTDSLMRGDEVGLGTPQEDIASIAAVHSLDVPRKFLVCLGFGIDTFHGVNHFQFLEAVAALTKSGHFLGAFSLLNEMEEVQRYQDAYSYVQERMSGHPSIVSTSIISAINGEYGDYHATHRTKGGKLWINPLMTLYWCFWLDGVAERCLYLDEIKDVEGYMELTQKIGAVRARQDIRGWDDIPA